MANDGVVQIPPDNSGKLIDHSVVPTSSGTTYRQRVVIGDDNGDLAVTHGSLQVDFEPLQRMAIRVAALQFQMAQAIPATGFVPMEFPDFLGGF